MIYRESEIKRIAALLLAMPPGHFLLPSRKLDSVKLVRFIIENAEGLEAIPCLPDDPGPHRVKPLRRSKDAA